jgi:hypothetical protein
MKSILGESSQSSSNLEHGTKQDKMASRYGKKHNLPGYDSFRTGLSYRAVWEMLRNESDDPREWKYKSRGVILGMWHEIKLQLYYQAIDTGMEVEKCSGVTIFGRL